MAKQKFEKLTTPKGRAQYPHLNRPDTKFNENGEYKVDLILDEADAEAFCQKIDELTEENWNNVMNKASAKDKKKLEKHYPYEEVLDEETEEATGQIKIKTKCNAQITKEDGTVIKLAPKLFDKAGRAVPEDKYIRGGSTIRCNVECVPYKVAATSKVGISLRLKAVQVLEFAEGGRAEDFGFETEPEEEEEAAETGPGFEAETADEDGDF